MWRAEAIERAGGWNASSLVEDCELSFRILFAGYHTTFAQVAVPAEVPASVTAYKAQQKRWTFGWAQLLRIHLGSLLFRYECHPLKRLHLLYHMTLSLQWPLWMVWQLMNRLDAAVAAAAGAHILYFAPLLVHMVASAGIATAGWPRLRRLPIDGPARTDPMRVLLLQVVPSAAPSAMLPHQARRRPARPPHKAAHVPARGLTLPLMVGLWCGCRHARGSRSLHRSRRV